MPDRQTVTWHITAQGGGSGSSQQRCHGIGRNNPHQQAEEHQNLHRHLHVARRFMRRVMRQVDRLAVEKHVVDKAQRIRHREHPGQCGRRRNHPVEAAQQVLIERFGKEHFLAQEAIEQRHPGHRRGCHHRQNRRVRHVLPHTVDAPHIAATGFVVDDPCRHKQRGLEGGVVDDMEHRCHGGQAGIEAEQQGNQAQVADR